MIPNKEQLNLFGVALVDVLTGTPDISSAQKTSVSANLATYQFDVGASALRQLGVRDTSSGLRLSQLGKPAVIQACNLPHVSKELLQLGLQVEEQKTMKMRELLHRGDQWEAWVITVLKIFGCDVTQEQADVEYMGVKGHIDFVIEGLPGADCGPVLVEVKTMSSRYFSSFTRAPDDARGYLTQLTCYSKAMGLPAVWLCLDKSTHNVAVVHHPGGSDEVAVLDRLARIVPKLNAVESLQDVFAMFGPPPGVPEVYQRKTTGNTLLPPSMRYSPLRHLFYKIVTTTNQYNKPVEYIGGVRNYNDAISYVADCAQLVDTSDKQPTPH